MTSHRDLRSSRIAFVHDWLTGMRGGERVLQALCTQYPHADLFTLIHVPGSVSAAIERHRPRASVLNRLPGVRHYYRACLPLFPAAIEQFAIDDYDLVLSTSHCAAKSVVIPGHTRHLCYCFTPMRYAWDQFEAYFGRARFGPLSTAMRIALRRLARWDAATSHRPQRYVAISRYVAQRIERYYHRPAAVVHPPVDTDFFQPSGGPPEDFVLVVSALVPYKRVDLAIDACRLAGRRLVIIGKGPERARLERLGGDVEFLGALPDAAVRDYYQRCEAVLLTGEEDFGLVPVEAQACGRPVIVFGRGGGRETIVEGETGLLVDESSPEAFAAALERLRRLPWDPQSIRRHAERFSSPVFLQALERELDDLLNAPAERARW